MIIILDRSPRNTHILLVEDEEISTFWHGHRNRCFIFCVKCDENKKALFLKAYLCCLNIYGYNQQNPKIERKTKKRNVGRNFEKKGDCLQND